jgi:hypothetical protein
MRLGMLEERAENQIAAGQMRRGNRGVGGF